MKLFIDTANVDEIRQAEAYGFLGGVTTNPTLIARERCPFQQQVKKIVELVHGPVNAEVISTTADEMIAEGKALAAIAKNIVVKIPMCAEGLTAVSKLSLLGVPTNVTLVFSAAQALLACQAGASYVSIFVGRADDVGFDGTRVIAQVAELFTLHDVETRIIAASVRGPKQVVDASAAGAHIVTAPFKVLLQMMKNPLTDAGLEKFMEDWKAAQASVAVG